MDKTKDQILREVRTLREHYLERVGKVKEDLDDYNKNMRSSLSTRIESFYQAISPHDIKMASSICESIKHNIGLKRDYNNSLNERLEKDKKEIVKNFRLVISQNPEIREEIEPLIIKLENEINQKIYKPLSLVFPIQFD